MNVGLDHLSQLELGESGGSRDNQLPNTDMFRIKGVPDYLENIATFLATGNCLEEYTTTKRGHMVVRATDYQLIAGQLYKLGLEYVLL